MLEIARVDIATEMLASNCSEEKGKPPERRGYILLFVSESSALCFDLEGSGWWIRSHDQVRKMVANTGAQLITAINDTLRSPAVPFAEHSFLL